MTQIHKLETMVGNGAVSCWRWASETAALMIYHLMAITGAMSAEDRWRSLDREGVGRLVGGKPGDHIHYGPLVFTLADGSGTAENPFVVNLEVDFNAIAEAGEAAVKRCDWGPGTFQPTSLAWFTRSAKAHGLFTHCDFYGNQSQLFHPKDTEDSVAETVERICAYVVRIDTADAGPLRDQTLADLRELVRVFLINVKGGNLINIKPLEALGYTFRTETGTPNLKVWLQTKRQGEICIYGWED